MSHSLDAAFGEIFDTEQPLFKESNIGPCEVCGAVDHQLINGLCITCKKKFDFQGEQR